MKKVHSSPNAVDIHNIKNVLEGSGIECEIRGEFRRGAVGEIPINECWIDLWILNDTDETNARQIIDTPLSGSAPAWCCAGCGESIDGQFDQCWKCDAKRPAPAE
jgi:hypothetical protein